MEKGMGTEVVGGYGGAATGVGGDCAAGVPFCRGGEQSTFGGGEGGVAGFKLRVSG